MNLTISSAEDLLEVTIELLDDRHFKIERILENTGRDGGRDIEAYTFHTDSSDYECITKWWIELKYRSQDNLGIKDFTDLSSKLERAANQEVDMFLLITNRFINQETWENLSKRAKQLKLGIRLWDQYKLNVLLNKKKPKVIEGGRIRISDRLNEIKKLTSILNIDYKSVCCITGSGGIGKSTLARYLMYHYSSDFVFGIIDCRIKRDLGIGFKMLAQNLLNQGVENSFSISAYQKFSEYERIKLFYDHCSQNKTILLIDNFEEILDDSGHIDSPIIKELIKYFLTHNVNGSKLLITSRDSIREPEIITEEGYFDEELHGWDIDFVYNNYLPYLTFLQTKLGEIEDTESSNRERLEIFKGNPLALKIANRLCVHYSYKKLISFITDAENPADKLIEAFSRKLDVDQINALNLFSQFKRPLSIVEIEEFVCSKNILDSLVILTLIEQTDTDGKQFQMHPLTAQKFSLDGDERKEKVLKKLIKKLEIHVETSKESLDSIYNHGLLRQVIGYLIDLRDFERAAEHLIKIGTRAVSMGDIDYLTDILKRIEDNISSETKAKLLKLRGHILDFKGDYRGATETYREMVKAGSTFNNSWIKSAGLNGLGSMERFQGKFDNAISYYTESLQLRLISNDLVAQSNSYHNLGAVYLEQENTQMAKMALEKAYQIRKKLDDKFRMSATLVYLSECYVYMREYDNGKKYIEECIQLKESINDPLGLLWAKLCLLKIEILNIIDEDKSKVEKTISWCKRNSDLMSQAHAEMLTFVFEGCCNFLYFNNRDASTMSFMNALKIVNKLKHSTQQRSVRKAIDLLMSGKEDNELKTDLKEIAFSFKI